MMRRGYSLIELVVAMIAATALVSSLAATLVITTQLLEVPPDNQAVWHDRDLADRLAADLRYATGIDESPTYGFTITRPDPAMGGPQRVAYEAYLNGLTRRVDDGPTIVFDRQAPSHTFQVDGYSAPTASLSPSNCVRMRSTSQAASPGLVSSINIDVPPGCKDGDLLLVCVSAKTPTMVNVSDSNWQTLSIQAIDSLRMVNVYRNYDASLPDELTISVAPAAAIAAVAVALELADRSQPINARSTSGGYALSWYAPSHPMPIETAGFRPGQLNLQIFAAERDPWHEGSLGLASFADAVQVTAAAGNASLENSIGIATRSGPTATMSTTPRLQHESSGFWLQCGVRVEVEQ